MAYHHDSQLYKKQKKSKRILRFGALLIVLLVVGALAVLLDRLLNQSGAVEGVDTGAQARVQSSTINIFRTPYFQFQTDRSWREVTEESSDKRYVYRSYNDFLVEHELIVEVDDIREVLLDNEMTTRVFPVTIEGNLLKPVNGVSSHCKNYVTEGQKEQEVISFQGASFPCVPDGSSFVALVSLVGGNEVIEKRVNGVDRRYKIRYQDSTFSPSGRPLGGIVRSFQLL